MPKYVSRALLAWMLVAMTEIIHGGIRNAFLTPFVGDVRARQIGAVVGALLVLLVACLCVRWVGARTRQSLVGVGLLWLCLMLAFEVAGGRFFAGYSWSRIASDYDLRQGGILGLGMLVLALSPLIAARIRGVPPYTRA